MKVFADFESAWVLFEALQPRAVTTAAVGSAQRFNIVEIEDLGLGIFSLSGPLVLRLAAPHRVGARAFATVQRR